MINKIYSKIIKRYDLADKSAKEVFLVLGESRSGTSLIMELLKEAGIFIGQAKDLKSSDQGNPHGYFEYRQVHKLNQALQSSGRIKHWFTKITVIKFLAKINQQADKAWALKIHPFLFPLWQSYLPKFKLVLIYRHPVIVAHSNVKLKEFTNLFHDYILKWEKSYRELIYYYYRYPSIMMDYDDLMDPEKRGKVLEKFVDFLGQGEIEKLKQVISTDLDRSSKEMEKIIDIYPLPQETKAVLKTLEKIKA